MRRFIEQFDGPNQLGEKKVLWLINIYEVHAQFVLSFYEDNLDIIDHSITNVTESLASFIEVDDFRNNKRSSVL